MTPLRVQLPYQRDATNVSRKPIFSDDDIHFDEPFGVWPTDDDADCLERQPRHPDTNEFQSLGLQCRVGRECKDGVRCRDRMMPLVQVSSIPGRYHWNTRSASRRDSRPAVAAQREYENQRGCNRADCPEEWSYVRSIASTLPMLMLQRLPRGEHSWFELRWSGHRRILACEVTPRLADCSRVTPYVARRVVYS
jgi:hypothetical protein